MIVFVGEFGGGKLMFFCYMFWYYDCDEGSIELDGQNVKDFIIVLVRCYIGVVLQDMVFFNEIIMYNLKYVNLEVIEEQVIEVCKVVSIYDCIMFFLDKYEL